MFVDIFNTDNKYRTIILDPPWMEKGAGKIKRGADRHYPLMKTEEIQSLPIKNLADQNGCHIYLWTTNNFMEDAFDCLKIWGFEYITCITWMKDKMGLGQYYRGITEHCLFGTTKNRLPYKVIDGKRQQGLTGFYEPRTIHSKKPEKIFEFVEKVSYSPFIELFARNKRSGYDCWGNEIVVEESNAND